MLPKTAPIEIVLIMVSMSCAFAQWQDPTLTRGSGVTAENQGSLFASPPVDESGESPHTVFERMERTLMGPKPDAVIASAPGTVSVAELRHPLSRLGASLIQRAQHYAAAGEHTKAIEVLKEALVENSAVAYAHSFLGVEYLKIGDLHAAIANLREAVTLLPSIAANHSNLGYALCQIGDRKAGEQELRDAIKVDGITPKPHFVLGVILLDRGAPEARDHLLLAQSGVLAARLALAVYYERRGELSAAQENLREYLRSNHSMTVTALTAWIARAATLNTPASAFGFPPAEDR